MKVWLILAVTWVWWAVIVGPEVLVCSSSLSMTGEGNNNNLFIDKVEFRVTGCTKTSYSAFLQSLRTYLSSGTSMYNILLLPAQSGSQQNLLFAQLFDWDSTPITLVLNRTNAYVIAYQAQNRYYLLADTPDNPQLYGSNRYYLTFKGSYSALQNVAKENRENIDLGINQLAAAVSALYYWSPPTVETSVARALIVLIQMVSEAARFRAIEQRVTNNIIDNLSPIRYDSFRPGVGVMDLETNWETLSTAVQQSNQGNFLQPVTLKVSDQKTVIISDAEKARTYCGLALLLYWRQSQALLSSRVSSVLSAISLHLNVRPILDIAA